MYIIIAGMLLSSIAVSAQCSVLVTGNTNVSCFGSCDGTVSLSTIGVPNYTYLWAPGGQTIQNPTDLCPGTHTVTMTDANACQATATVTITEPAQLTTSTTQTDASCNGNCNGSATVSASGGTPLYTYAWDTVASSQLPTANNLCAGTYSVLVTDNNGCTSSSTVTITEPSPMDVSATSTPTSCSACTDGTATASVSGGTPSYSYLWSPGGQTTPTASNLGAGSYTVLVTDAQGCTNTDTVEVFSPNGITSWNGVFGIRLYPNPAPTVANIEIENQPVNSRMRISIFDITGNTIRVTEYSSGVNIVQIDMSEFPAGSYLIEIRINDSRQVIKLQH